MKAKYTYHKEKVYKLSSQSTHVWIHKGSTTEYIELRVSNLSIPGIKNEKNHTIVRLKIITRSENNK